MAILDSDFRFLGTIGDFTAYRIPGKKEIIVKRKSVVPKEVIKTSPAFVNSRRVSTEFGGRGTMSGWIRRAMYPLDRVTEKSVTGPLNAVMKPVQELDKESRYGERNIFLSRGRDLLDGFQLNEDVALESVLRCNLATMLTRETAEAEVVVPELIPGSNFYPPSGFPMFRVVAVVGIVPDLVFHSGKYTPAVAMSWGVRPVSVASDWLVTAHGSGRLQLRLTYNHTLLSPGVSLILTAGVQFGKLAKANTVVPTRKAGAAKVCVVV